MPSREDACINGLRADVALQIGRRLRDRGLSQVAAAKRLGVPQPTLSKIVNGHVAEISLELLLRIAVRLRLPLVLQTGQAAGEAGAFLPAGFGAAARGSGSFLADAARDSLHEDIRRLTHEQRLDAFLQHNQLVSELHEARLNAENDPSKHARRE